MHTFSPGFTIARVTKSSSMWIKFVQPIDLLTLALACYLLTDALVNRALPFNIMGRIRERLQWGALTCFYCAAFWCGIAVYLVWLIEPRLLIPFAAGGAAVLSWRYTGSNAI